jgi:hypothetical protein
MKSATTTQNDTFDSVFPDFLRTGLGKLSELDSRRELLALYAALEDFRHDLHQQDSGAGILEATHRYVTGLHLFRAMGFWIDNYLTTHSSAALALGVCPEGKSNFLADLTPKS